MIKKQAIITLAFFYFIALSEAQAFDPLLTSKALPKTLINYSQNEECGKINNADINIFDAVNIALCKNPGTKSAWLSVKSQQANLGIAKSEFMPNISFSAAEDYSKNAGQKSNADLGVNASLNWLLYDFGKTNAAISAEYFNTVEEAYKYNKNVQDLIYEVIESYCNLFSSKEEVEAALRAEESYKAAYKTALEKYDLGLVPKADVLKSETEYAQRTLIKQKAENSTAIYKGQLLKLLSLEQGTNLNLLKPTLIQDINMINYNVNILIKDAIKDRPDLQALIAKEKAYRQTNKSIKRKSLPSISLYGSSNKDDIEGGGFHKGLNNTIGLKVSIPIFTGFEQSYSVKRAKYQLEAVKSEKKEAEDLIGYEIWSAYQDLKTAEDNFKVCEKMIKSAKESKDVAAGMYKAGKNSMLEVLDAEASYAEAEKEYISAEYGKIIAQASLLKAIGKLDKKFLSKF